MSEIKTPLYKVGQGESFRVDPLPTLLVADAETYVITEDHTLSDILRYLLDCAGGDKSEIQYLLDQEPD